MFPEQLKRRVESIDDNHTIEEPPDSWFEAILCPDKFVSGADYAGEIGLKSHAVESARAFQREKRGPTAPILREITRAGNSVIECFHQHRLQAVFQGGFNRRYITFLNRYQIGEDTKDAPTDRLAYLALVDGSRAPVEPGVAAELSAMLRDDAVVRYEGTSFVYESEESVSGLDDALVRGDAFLHVCCLYHGPYSRDTVYTEQVFGFNINRDGLRAMPEPDTVYIRP